MGRTPEEVKATAEAAAVQKVLVWASSKDASDADEKEDDAAETPPRKEAGAETSPAPAPAEESASDDQVQSLSDQFPSEIAELESLQAQLIKAVKEAVKQARVAETYATMNKRVASFTGGNAEEAETARGEAAAAAGTA